MEVNCGSADWLGQVHPLPAHEVEARAMIYKGGRAYIFGKYMYTAI